MLLGIINYPSSCKRVDWVSFTLLTHDFWLVSGFIINSIRVIRQLETSSRCHWMQTLFTYEISFHLSWAVWKTNTVTPNGVFEELKL